MLYINVSFFLDFIEVIKKSQRSQKEYAYLALKSLIETYPEQIRISMPNLIHVIASDIHDINKDIKKNASDVLELLLKCSGNSDLDVFIPDVLKGIKDPKIIYNSVEALASCVFVQIVDFMYIENRRLNLFLLLCLFVNND